MLLLLGLQDTWHITVDLHPFQLKIRIRHPERTNYTTSIYIFSETISFIWFILFHTYTFWSLLCSYTIASKCFQNLCNTHIVSLYSILHIHFLGFWKLIALKQREYWRIWVHLFAFDLSCMRASIYFRYYFLAYFGKPVVILPFLLLLLLLKNARIFVWKKFVRIPYNVGGDWDWLQQYQLKMSLFLA